MTPSDNRIQLGSDRTQTEPADDLFWLSQLEEDVPRAQIVPSTNRSQAEARTYLTFSFSLDPEVVGILRSLDKARGVSDLVLCATLLASLLAKYHRDDRLTIGLQTTGDGAASSAMVPLRLVCPPEATVLTLMRSIAEEVAKVQGHTPCTVSRMAQILGVELTSDRCPFFNIGLALGEGNGGVDFNTYPLDMLFVFHASAARLYGRVVYVAELFEAARVERLVSHLLNAARQLSQKPSTTLAIVDILSDDERRLVLEEFDGRSVVFPVDRTFHALFEEQVRQVPSAIAAIHRDTRLTYAELNSQANRVANTLLSLGLQKGAFVGILLNRSCDFVIAMLGIFKAGAAYVPLDPLYPRDRVRYMLDDSQSAFIVSNASVIEAFRDVISAAPGLQVILSLEGSLEAPLSEGGERAIAVVAPDVIASGAPSSPELPLVGTDRAYMIYTSGSTGRPKGAICRHNGALNHLYGELDGLGVRGSFSFLQTASSSSDISVWQFMAPLLFGGATVIVDYDVVVDPAQLFAAIRNHDIAIAEVVPVVLRALIDYITDLPSTERHLPALRAMMSTGEALPAELVDRWLATYPEIPIANTYGPTETSDDVTLLVLRKPLGRSRASAPLGKALPNVSVYILDPGLKPVPIGVPGEICIGGIAVGEGYWQQPEKTESAFVRFLRSEGDSPVIYRTGDLGWWLEDGTVEFLGRIDHQAKVRGFRVEPGEIEAMMTQHPLVRDAAVVTVEDSSGGRRLIGYFVVHQDQSLAPGDLRQFLKGELAEHMVPAALVPLTALPLTPLGKVDRKALASIEDHESRGGQPYVAPANKIEEVLANAWSTVLGLRRVSVHDNFFEVGGDSMLTIRLVTELKKAGITLAPKDIFIHPTVAELAKHAESVQERIASQQEMPASTETQRDLQALREQLALMFPDLKDVYSLSATQRGIYYQCILAPKKSGAYIEQIEFDLTGDLNQDVFAQAWQHTINSIDVLRTAIIRRSVPQPMQVVLHSATLGMEVLDWRRLPVAQQTSGLQAMVVADREKGFDLRIPPLTRLTLVRLTDRRWHVLWTYHHIILDGWSEPLVLNAAFNEYNLMMGMPPLQSVNPTRYRDFVVWSESQNLHNAESFWRQQLAGFVSPVSIRDNSPSIEPPSNVELSHGFHEVLLTEGETARLQELTRRAKVTLSTIIHGAWGLILHRRTGSMDVVFGSVASGRQCELSTVESISGVLVVTQPLRTRLAPDVTVSSWLRLVQLEMAEMREFEHTPLARIQEWCDVPPAKRPLFDSLVVMANYFGSDLSNCHLDGIHLSNVTYVTQPLYALTLFIVPGPMMSVRLVYDKRKYALATVRNLLDEYVQLLKSIAEKPEQRLGAS